jgi:hypothetical protein
MDANNYFKCLADSITESKCVWIDDTQLCERVQSIFYDSQNPRIEITIYPVEYIGIFENHAQLKEFETTCVQCKKYKNGKCNLLVKAKIGKIQEEINNKRCNKFLEE